jgi:dihydrodipicolinate synthase/N-acetylneuraminate lyase
VAFGRPLGADGAYSNVACLLPAGAVRHWDLAATDPEAARGVEDRFRRFLHETMIPLARDHGLSDAALDKAMATAGGWGPVGPDLLWPYSGATPGMVEAIRASAQELLPDLMEGLAISS